MKPMARIFGGAALAAVLAAGPMIAADHPGRGGRMGGMLKHALSALDLTQDQKTKIHAILDAEKPAIQALREQFRTDRRALRDASDSSDAQRRGDRRTSPAATRLRSEPGYSSPCSWHRKPSTFGVQRSASPFVGRSL